MGNASVSIFPWPECRHIQGMHVQLLSRSQCYQHKYNCGHILRYIYDGRCQCLQAAQPQIASCNAFIFSPFLNKDLPMALITNDNSFNENIMANITTSTGMDFVRLFLQPRKTRFCGPWTRALPGLVPHGYPWVCPGLRQPSLTG